jgi:hypothetical protein
MALGDLLNKPALTWARGFIDNLGAAWGFRHNDGRINVVPVAADGTAPETKITDGTDIVDIHTGGDTPAAGGKGLIVYSEEVQKYGGLVEGVTALAPAVDENGSIDMNVSVGFTGTPEIVHDGTDRAAWAGSAISGSWTFNDTSHGHQGIITVIDYTALSGKIITIQGTNITNTVLTEGVDWTAATSNDATASSIQSAVDGVAGVSATVSSAVVEVTADNGITQADITTLTTDAAAGEMTASARGIDATATANGDEALFEDTGSIDMSNYTAISLAIYLTKWNDLQSNEITLRARLNGVDVGTAVNLSDFIDTASLNHWQEIAMSKSELGLDTDTIDEFVIKTIANAGEPNAPDYFIDHFQVEETGEPHTFSWEPPAGTMFIFQKEEVAFAATSAITALAPDEFITLPRLNIGLVSRLTINGVTTVATIVRDNFDFNSLGSTRPVEFISNGSKIFGKFVYNPGENSPFGAVILRSSTGDGVAFDVNDDLSGLDKLQFRLIGQLVQEIN